MKRPHTCARADDSPVSGAALRVFVVESSPDLLREMCRQLAGIDGAELTGTARSLSPALQKIRLLAPDLVICDLHLAGGNGLDLSRRAHALQPRCRVIIVSLVAGEMRTASLANGADGFVVQSRLGDELGAEIRRLFPSRVPESARAAPPG